MFDPSWEARACSSNRACLKEASLLPCRFFQFSAPRLHWFVMLPFLSNIALLVFELAAIAGFNNKWAKVNPNEAKRRRRRRRSEGSLFNSADLSNQVMVCLLLLDPTILLLHACLDFSSIKVTFTVEKRCLSIYLNFLHLLTHTLRHLVQCTFGMLIPFVNQCRQARQFERFYCDRSYLHMELLCGSVDIGISVGRNRASTSLDRIDIKVGAPSIMLICG